MEALDGTPRAGLAVPPLGLPPEPAESDGLSVFILSFFGWTIGWVLLFYLLCRTQHVWMKGIPRSCKTFENDKYWCARNIVGIVHALLISVISVPCLLAIASKSEDAQFSFSLHVGECTPDPSQMFSATEVLIGQAIAFAGLVFSAFTFADVFISVVHGLATIDYIVHHFAFIAAGLIIRGNCILPLNAAILLSMEVSTPFLNFLLFFRHRGDSYSKWCSLAGVMFFVTFVLSRIICNTYGAVILWVKRGTALPAAVPAWQAWFLLAAVTAGAAVQFFWFPRIARNFAAGISGLLQRGSEPSELLEGGSIEGCKLGSPAEAEEDAPMNCTGNDSACEI